MQKFFTFLGGCFVVILIVIGVSLAIFIPRGLKLDREATAYIQESVPKIISPWSSQALVDRATPELMATAKSPDDIQNLFETFRTLGALKHLGEPKGMVTTMSFTGKGSTTVGNYAIPVEFENGKATISLQIKLEGDRWRINGFHLNGNALPRKSPRPLSA